MKIAKIIEDIEDRAEVTKMYRGAVLVWPLGDKAANPYPITQAQLKSLLNKGILRRYYGFGSDDNPHYVGKDWPWKKV